jgi:flagellar protein FliL
MAKSDPESELQEGAAPPPAKTPSPWVPVIAMVVLMPAITYGMTQFLILPKIRGAVGEQKAHAAAAGHGKGEAKGKGEHGKGEHGKGADTNGQFTYDFDNVVVNLSGAMGTRYLKTSFTTYSENADLKKVIDENKKQLLDVAITVLGSRTLADLEQPGAKNVVRSDLMANFNQAVKSDLINQIYFSEFVVQ